MRKMKRALSLVLAVVMLLGMVMVPTGAAGSKFTDADLIENTDAVQITSGIGLFAGTTDGQFAPKAAVTRAQMATIIVKMLHGSDFNADAFKGVGINPFPDTAAFEGGWAEGYINACSQLGVVAGYGDGTFKPGKTLTTAEAMTMIINALGVDPGEGEWPLNYMAKAEEMKLYGDLATKPGSDVPLTRDQLAVIVWEGLQYSPADKSGWRVPGTDLVFTEYVDALKANKNETQGISPVVGEDSLASKVYGIKAATGIISANQATDEDCTILRSVQGSEEERYDVQTSLDMLGHYVTIYYKEKFDSTAKPGLTYTVVDESTVVSVQKIISNDSKAYKEAFEKSRKLMQKDGKDNVLLFDKDYNLKTPERGSIPKLDGVSYTAGTSAPKGTYIIANGEVVSYIEPVPVYASYISGITTIDGGETVSLAGQALPNAPDNDKVIEYPGMASGDIVTYVVVNGIYMLYPVQKVTGTVQKTSSMEINDETYSTITIDNVTYPAFEHTGITKGNKDKGSRNFVGGKLSYEISDVVFGESYTLYVADNGHYVGFEAANNVADLENTVFLVGCMIIRQTDEYGVTYHVNNARGVDMSGSEVMIPLGRVKDDGVKNEQGRPVYDETKDTAELLGTMYSVEKGFYTVDDHEEKEEKKLGIKVVTPYQQAPTVENPTYATRTWMNNTSWTGSSSIVTTNGLHAFNKTSTTYLVITGDVNGSAPLSATVSTGTMSTPVELMYGEKSGYLLVTNNNVQSDIEIFVQFIEQELAEYKYVYITQDQLDTKGEVSEGIAYQAYDLNSGKEEQVVLDREAAQIDKPGFTQLEVLDEDLYAASICGLDMRDVTGRKDDAPDVQVQIGNVAFLGLTGSRMRFQRAAGDETAMIVNRDGKIEMNAVRKAIDGYDNVEYNNGSATSTAVFDLRTDKEMLESGVGKITSLTQLNELSQNDPSLVAILDMSMYGHNISYKLNTAFVKRVVSGTVGLNSVLWLDDGAFFTQNGKTYAEAMVVTSKTAKMGEVKNVFVDEAMDYGTGFYRYMVDADGDIKLVPFDMANIGSTFRGTYGVLGLHNVITDSPVWSNGDLKISTQDHTDDTCQFDCTNTGFEALSTVNLTKDTVIYELVNGTLEKRDRDQIEKWVNEDKVALEVDYYCAGAIKDDNANSVNKDTAAELLIVTGKQSRFTTSCDGDHAGWTAISGATTISQSGNYYLTGDVNGRITVTAQNVKLCMNGHSITHNDVALRIDNGTAELINCQMADSVITGATKNSCVAVEMWGALTINEGVHVTGAKGVAQAVMVSDSTFNMKGGSVKGNEGVGVNVCDSGVFNMSGGTISNNITTANGGGVLVDANSTFNMSGGNISKNEAANGAGVYMTNGAAFTMTGGTIGGNSASNHGGGVYINVGLFELRNGTIAGNTAGKNNGAGVFINYDGQLTMTGGSVSGSGNLLYSISNGKKPSVISGGEISGIVLISNTSNSEGRSQLELTGDVVVTGTVNSYGKVTVSGGTIKGDMISNGTNEDHGIIITGGTMEGSLSAQSANAILDISGGTFKSEPDAAFLADGGKAVQNPDGTFTVVSDATGDSEHDASWTHITNANLVGGVYTITTAGGYCLDEDLNGQIAINGNIAVDLCLCGKSITAGSTGAIQVAGGAQVELDNCSKTTGKIKATGNGILIDSGNVTMLEKIQVTGCTDSGVRLNSGEFTLDGGTINGNTAENGGGVYVQSGTFNLKDGTINNNKATTGTQWTAGGAAVYVAEAGTMNMSGGTITGNSATNHGAGVFTYGIFNMTGGSITGNTAGKANGSGVMVRGNSARFTMTDGTLSGAGNLIYTINGAAKAEISGGTLDGTIYTNDATNILNLSGDVTVSGTIGGAAKITMAGGTVGGIATTAASVVTMTDGTVKADMTSDGTVNISGGAVKGNLTVGGTATITGGFFSGSLTEKGAGELTVMAGNFKKDPSAFLGEDGQSTQNANGTFTVVDNNKCVDDHAAYQYHITNADLVDGVYTITTAGDYCLAGDLDGQIAVSGNIQVEICLAGHTITAGGTSAISAAGGAQVNVKTCRDTTAAIACTETALEGNVILGSNITVVENDKCLNDHGTALWTHITNAKMVGGVYTITKAGCYCLDEDLNGQIAVSGNIQVEICMAGHSITAGGVSAITAAGSARVNVTSCKTGAAVVSTENAVSGNVVIGAGVSVKDNDKCMENHTLAPWTHISNADLSGGVYPITTSGSYCLDENLNGQIAVSGGAQVTLCMGGHTITASGKSAIVAAGGANVTISTCTDTEGTITSNVNGITVDGGSLTLVENVKVTGCSDSGVLVKSGTFTLDGGTISGNTAENGGGVYVAGGTFVMNAGTISNNTATGAKTWTVGGGGVYVAEGSFTMNNGTITANKSSVSYGGGVLTQGVFTMNGGTISNNKAGGTNGSGVLTTGTNGRIFIKGGTVSGEGNLVYGIYGSTVEQIVISGGIVSRGSNTDGYVIIQGTKESALKISGDAYIYGRIYFNASATKEISGGEFTVDPSAGLAAGYKATKSGDNWIVEPAN